jgi:hypothetical protein
MLKGPINEERDLSPVLLLNDPTSEPILSKLLNELVKVEVTEAQPSLVGSGDGVTERGVMLTELTLELCNDDTVGIVLETDRVGRNALGGATFAD